MVMFAGVCLTAYRRCSPLLGLSFLSFSLKWRVFFFSVAINSDIYIFVQGEVFARVVVHTPVPADGSGVGHAVVKGLMPRGGLVKLLIKALDGVKGS